LNRLVKKGDVYYANLDGAIGSEQSGNRPVVIVQNDTGNFHANTVIVLPLTKKYDKKVKLPTHIPINAYKGISVDSTILAEQIRTIDKSRLTRKICKVPNKLMKEIDMAMAIAIGIIDNKEIERMGFLNRLILFFGGNKNGI